jgi:hypothetical protein
MGEWGRVEDMKSQKTNLEAVEPSADKPEQPESMAKHPHRPEIRLGREAQARIGELLRNMYNSYVNQGVPSHLADLVRRLGDEG